MELFQKFLENNPTELLSLTLSYMIPSSVLQGNSPKVTSVTNSFVLGTISDNIHEHLKKNTSAVSSEIFDIMNWNELLENWHENFRVPLAIHVGPLQKL